MVGLGIKIKWPGTGADGGVLRAWWLAVDVAGQVLVPGGGQHVHARYWAVWAGRGAMMRNMGSAAGSDAVAGGAAGPAAGTLAGR